MMTDALAAVVSVLSDGAAGVMLAVVVAAAAGLCAAIRGWV